MKPGKTSVIVGLMAGMLLMQAASFAASLEDQYADIVFSNYHTGGNYNLNSYVYWGSDTPRAYGDGSRTDLPTAGALGNTLADLDNDGHTDIVFGNSSPWVTNSYVYWGDGTTAFSQEKLPSIGTWCVSAGDVDGDHDMDLVLSNYYSGVSYYVNSYIYWGDGSGGYEPVPKEMQTNGAWGNRIADLDKDGTTDIVFANLYGGSTYVYWGNDNYTTPTPLASGASVDCSVADIDRDGNLDIVITNLGSNVYVYWGKNDETRYTTYDTYAVGGGQRGVNTVDVNSDGFLDLVISNYDVTNSYIYWGSETNRFSQSTPVPVGANSYNNAAGDIDGDGYLDLVFAGYYGNSAVFWGDATPMVYIDNSSVTFPTIEATAVSLTTGSHSLGNVLPLWATENDIGWDVLSSPEYTYIDVKNGLLNDGALDLTELEAAQIAQLYLEGKAGGSPMDITIDGITWSYFDETLPGHDTPSAWYDGGNYYFQFGSGVMGQEGVGEVPEPSTLLLLVGLGALMLLKMKGKRP